MALNDRAIKNAKPKDKPFKLSDRDGLHLLVNPGGSKLWRVDYTFASKRRTLALGKYPQISLMEARQARIDMREQVDAGHDPVLKRKEEKRQREMSNRTTFEAVAGVYLQRVTDSGNQRETVHRYQRQLEADVYPFIGSYPIGEIKPAQLLEVLQRIEQSGRRYLAHRLRSLCSPLTP